MLHDRDNTVTESATQLTILPSPKRISPVSPRENGWIASLVPTSKSLSLPRQTPNRCQWCKEKPLQEASGQEAGGPKCPVQMLWHHPLPPPSSLRGELPITEVWGWLRKWLTILALPDAIPGYSVLKVGDSL